ncbi:MAG: barstar family protein [Bacteroidota bacterium]|nr:barstar family protein [Bacteroidota bacterium]
MITPIKIINKKSQLIDNLKYNSFIAKLDGKTCVNLDEFYASISRSFQFPDYFGRNLDALYDCLVDLDWIHESEIKLFIINFDEFLIDEKDPTALASILNIFYEVAIERNLQQNDIGEKNFSIYFLNSEKAIKALAQMEIPYEKLHK